MGEVIQGDFPQDGDLPVNEVLESAKKHDLDTVIVVGRTGDGELFVSSSTLDATLLVYDLETAKLRIIYLADNDGNETED